MAIVAAVQNILINSKGEINMTHYLTEEQIIAALKVDGKVIGEQFRCGCKQAGKAEQVIKTYKMWQSCPGDSCAFVLCERAYAEWKAMQP